MPNWCVNELEVEGDKQDVFKVSVSVASPEYLLDFALIAPVPKCFATGENQKTGSEEAHQWKLTHWGTKWRPATCELKEGFQYQSSKDRTLVYEFQTAWSPPIPIVEKLGRI